MTTSQKRRTAVVSSYQEIILSIDDNHQVNNMGTVDGVPKNVGAGAGAGAVGDGKGGGGSPSDSPTDNPNAYDIDNGDEGEDDSLAAVASEDDDEEYSDFVDECGRSRCGDSVAGGAAGAGSRGSGSGSGGEVVAAPNSAVVRSTQYGSGGGGGTATIPFGSEQPAMVDRRSRKASMVYPSPQSAPVMMSQMPLQRPPGMTQRRITTPASATGYRLHQQEQQQRNVSYGPGGLVFNMDEPWERSLQRQINGGGPAGVLAVDPSRNRIMGGGKSSSTSQQTSRNYPASSSSTNKKESPKGETLLLGHTESRDYAIEVPQDDISLGTNTSSTVPCRMQIIHRSFLNNYLSYQYQHQQQLRQHNHNNMMMPNQDPYNQNVNYQYYQTTNNIYHGDKYNHHRGLHNQAEQDINALAGGGGGPPKVKIGDFVKGCRSADESTVSFLTNQFGNTPFDDRDETQYNTNPDLQNPFLNGSNHRDYNNHIMSHNKNQEKHFTTQNQFKQDQKDEDGTKADHVHFLRFLELEGLNPDLNKDATNNSALESDGSKSGFMNGYTNMTTDPACFCMGYNVLDYFIPPPENTVIHPSGGRGIRNSGRHYNSGMRSTSRLQRVEEGESTDHAPIIRGPNSHNNHHNINDSINNSTISFPQVPHVIDLTTTAGAAASAADLDMSYLRIQQQQQEHYHHNLPHQSPPNDGFGSHKNQMSHRGDCGQKYCGIDV